MNYIMKKRGTLMLALPLCLLLAACAEKSAESDAAEYSPQPSSENASKSWGRYSISFPSLPAIKSMYAFRRCVMLWL